MGWSQRGVVTGANMFGQSIGSAVGVALFGANATLGAGSRRTPADLDRASHHVFLGVVVVAVLMTLAAVAMPGVRPTADPSEETDPAEETDPPPGPGDQLAWSSGATDGGAVK